MDAAGAYEDAPQMLELGQTISAPHMHAYALEILAPSLVDGASVLDVGHGSGYLTLALALMVGVDGVAVGVEHFADLVSFSIANVKKSHSELLDNGRIRLKVGDGRVEDFMGDDDMLFHAIHVGAAAEEVPQALLDRLAPGGRMLMPVGVQHESQQLTLFEKTPDGEIESTELMSVLFVPLN